jgi:hypothetical protein
MFIEFKLKDGTTILLNPEHVVSIEAPVVLTGIQGGAQQLRIHCLEGRVFSLDPKAVSFDSLRAQIEVKELTNDVRPDKGSPVR